MRVAVDAETSGITGGLDNILSEVAQSNPALNLSFSPVVRFGQ